MSELTRDEIDRQAVGLYDYLMKQHEVNEADREVGIAVIATALRQRVEILEDTVNAARQDTVNLRAFINEVWIDERGTAWTKPTAWAYAQVCKARDAHQQRAEAAEAKLNDPEYQECCDFRLEAEARVKELRSKLTVDRAAAPVLSSQDGVVAIQWPEGIRYAFIARELLDGMVAHRNEREARVMEVEASYKALANVRFGEKFATPVLAIYEENERLKALELTWTREKPTVEGDYWHEHHEYPARIVSVWRTNRVLFAGVPNTGSYFLVSKVNGRWAGPIPLPKEGA